ncbi:transketolase [Magnetofaba australis]|uniref:Transketolase n=1 Tax=Magnetofaba australis IT-1 TaxID=1434232 RepID=A0A1Y2JZX4_9PROT|nr:transketolase [Magnetofaba australis]OSM00094.1 putative transketolase [Magnetofaba australis IT-1]
MSPEQDRLAITTLRMLAIDAIEQANSGHPGLPLGAAPMAYVLWRRIMKHNPTDPNWINRDRFILSAGHGSALLYGLLHLSGYDVSLQDVKDFRQWGSKTPGHPEYGHTPGVEATTGPLGQGVAMGVGMAMAERRIAESFNQSDVPPVMDHFTYAIVSDGDLMEGVASEAASLAGHLCLGKLIYLYDDNGITIEGSTDVAFSESVQRRFEAYEWHVQTVENGEDLDAIEAAVRAAQAEEERPSLICVKTQIGHGSPKANTAGVHGSPLKGEAMEGTRQFYNWPEERFHVPAEALETWRAGVESGKQAQASWEAALEAYVVRHPEQGKQFRAQMAGELPEGWKAAMASVEFGGKPALATRSASGATLNALADLLPNLIGGSADLAPSNNTDLKKYPERTLHFGIREHAMGAALNGMALHGGLIPFGGTFLVFADYMRGAMRLSALMDTHVVYVLTHDSIGVGEDGPTHQPVEHAASLRAIPNLTVFRPADAEETRAAWVWAIENPKPSCLLLTRQNLPILEGGASVDAGVARGGYVKADCDGVPALILIATGSEVPLALDAAKQLNASGTATRVVSLPSWELFEQQDAAYQQSVLPSQCRARLGIEMGVSMGWSRWIGDGGSMLAIDRFGASAPGGKIAEEYGFTVENVVAKAKALLG